MKKLIFLTSAIAVVLVSMLSCSKQGGLQTSQTAEILPFEDGFDNVVANANPVSLEHFIVSGEVCGGSNDGSIVGSFWLFFC